MFTLDDITPLNAIKKEAGIGSYKGMRWRMEKDEEGSLKVTIYPEPRAFACTPESEKEVRRFELSVQGREAAYEWLKKQYEDQRERWEKAPRI